MSAVEQIHLLAIDLKTAPREVRDALHFDRDELTVLLDRTRYRVGEFELVVLSTTERLELYGAGANWQQGFQELLREVRARGQSLPGFGRTRVTEQHGLEVAEHLMRVATGLESSPEDSLYAARDVELAAQAARLAH